MSYTMYLDNKQLRVSKLGKPTVQNVPWANKILSYANKQKKFSLVKQRYQSSKLDILVFRVSKLGKQRVECPLGKQRVGVSVRQTKCYSRLLGKEKKRVKCLYKVNKELKLSLLGK